MQGSLVMMLKSQHEVFQQSVAACCVHEGFCVGLC